MSVHEVRSKPSVPSERSTSSDDILRHLFEALHGPDPEEGGPDKCCDFDPIDPLDALPILRDAVVALEAALTAERAHHDARYDAVLGDPARKPKRRKKRPTQKPVGDR